MSPNQRKVLIFEAYPMFSGAQKISLNLCKVLHKNNFHLTLLLVNDPTKILQEKFAPYVNEIILIKASSRITKFGNFNKWLNFGNFVASFFFGLLPFYFNVFKLFLKRKFDYYYFCDPRGSVSMLPAAFFKGKKICYLQSKNKHSKFLAKFLYLTYVDTLLCPSRDVLESVPPSSKKVILHYGIDFSQYGEINAEHVKKEVEKLLLLKNNLNKVKFLYAGLIKPQKGVHHIIYALKELRDACGDFKTPVLFILGKPATPAEENFKAELEKFILENRLEKYIYWMGWKNNVLEWMKNVDYFMFATIDKEICDFEGFDKVIESSEGSPTVLIESSLCGLYSIAAGVTGVNEIITDNRNGHIYNPSKQGALLENMKYVTEKHPTFIDFPTRDLFTIEKFANKVMQVFQ